MGGPAQWPLTAAQIVVGRGQVDQCPRYCPWRAVGTPRGPSLRVTSRAIRDGGQGEEGDRLPAHRAAWAGFT